MNHTTFEVDEHTAQAIAALRPVFGVKTNAGVIRKALALAKIVAEHADGDRTITLVTKTGNMTILLAG